MEKKINILYINSSSALFGAERRLLDIIVNLDTKRFNSYILLSEEGKFSEKLKEMGIRTIFLNFKFKVGFLNLGHFISLTRDFLKISKDLKIDLFHINLHHRFSNFWLAFLLMRKPVLIHLRQNVWHDVFEKLIMSYCSRIICVSEFIKQSFLKKRRSDFLTKINRSKVEVIYDGIQIEKFSYEGSNFAWSEANKNGKGKIVGMVGALEYIKGQDIFIRAARSVSNIYSECKFIIVGEEYQSKRNDGQFKMHLVRMIKKLSLENIVFLLGYREDIPSIMNNLDILVQPSSHDALPGTLIEAMACQKPVIGTKVEGIPEVIGDEGAGILIERTPEALAKAILFYLDNPEEARRAGIIGRKRAEEMFDMKKNITKLEKVYRDCHLMY